ncbi:MAG: PorT family protein [Bacteroidales bacterium]|nr:PorT family protein [Bacteroidales bacterium]
MKKIFMTLFVIIAMTINASAQYKPFQFGLKVEPGVGWAKLNSEHLSNNKSKINFNWGFVGNFYFVENYGLSTGFNVKFMNNEYSFTDNRPEANANSTITRTIKNQYLEIPLGLTMRTEKIGDLRILGNVSYGMGFLLNTNEKNYDINKEEVLMETKYNKLRHALIVKLGVEYYVHKASCLTAALVFNNNFANIYKDNQQDVLLNNMCLEIGFMF